MKETRALAVLDDEEKCPIIRWKLAYDVDNNLVLYANGIDVAYLDDCINLLEFEDSDEVPKNVVFEYDKVNTKLKHVAIYK